MAAKFIRSKWLSYDGNHILKNIGHGNSQSIFFLSPLPQSIMRIKFFLYPFCSLLFLVFQLPGFLHAQVIGHIDHDANKNKQEKSNNNAGNNSYNSSGTESSSSDRESPGDGCLSSCISYIVTGCVTEGISGMIEYHRQLLDKQDSIPRITSIEILPEGAFNFFPGDTNSAYYFILPRVRASWGLFSTDFRIHEIFQVGNNLGTFRTYDWQILEFNFIIIPRFQLRIGDGLSNEVYTSSLFNEFSLGADYFSAKEKFRLGFETRYTADYVTGAVPRLEFSLAGYKKLVDNPHMKLSATIGFLDDLYYSNTNTWGLQTGFSIRFE